ncbi:Nudix family hydrolase [Luteimonas kalidii]|uniref:8-oxo-dGTP diphosphatase n=1 Tax=Luteimonas kalidii TaxID=3042025 RepID=A0ABT6JQR3_9GAMM|nr:Nudix family hydrolase [Luteimonas kalidii]MDH5833029.1 Nudix family hydrolase [Luteimonas kalidii]
MIPPSTADAGGDVPQSRPSVHVVAGVITDARGRILLARRAPGRELAGLWEFPGGKVDPGETPDGALVRELREELGIEVDIGAPLMVVPHLTPSRRLHLDVRHVRAWRGTPKGCEGQALAWVQPGRLARYDMPAPDRPVVAALMQPDRCLVTPSPGEDDGPWLDALAGALAAGVRRVQFRLHGVDDHRRRRLLAAALQSCGAVGAQLLVNGDAALAQEAGVGLHLPAAQLRGCGSRPVPAGQLLSASCHDADELALAEALGCDFALVGPVQATPSHPGQPGIGWARFEALREHVSLPLYAIGGLGVDDIATARSHGAQGVAAIRGLWGDGPAGQPGAAAAASAR